MEIKYFFPRLQARRGHRAGIFYIWHSASKCNTLLFVLTEACLQLIYAAPFVLLSILSFVVCAAIPALRRHALSVLVAPVAFGVCSLLGWLIFVLVEVYFRIGAVGTFKTITLALIFYVMPGVVGAWVSVRIVQVVKRKFQRARDLRTQITE